MVGRNESACIFFEVAADVCVDRVAARTDHPYVIRRGRTGREVQCVRVCVCVGWAAEVLVLSEM